MEIADVLAHLVENAHWAEGDLEKARDAVNAIRQDDNKNRAAPVEKRPVPDAPQA